MKKLSLTLAVLLLCCINLIAQQRSESEAIQIAQEFFGKKGLTPKLSVVSNQKVEAQVRKRVAAARKAPAKSQSFYVVNDEANNRFVIVSADERMYDILGYSNNNIFNINVVPEALLEMLADYDLQYNSMDVGSPLRNDVIREMASDVIEPLVESDWGQQSPFNDQCPINVSLPNNQRSVSGCVATAMAQVMNYHKYPKHGRNKFSYVTKYGSTLSMDYDTLRLDWSHIQNSYKTEHSSADSSEVAKLMLACGISVSMDYGQNEGNQSGAFSQNIPYALITYFGYNPNILFKEKNYYSDDEWDEMIKKDLRAGHPILYSGYNGVFGHQFILDGCDSEGLYHFNFGWNGSSDGYYRLSGTKHITYSSGQMMVYQITPEVYGTKEDVFYSNSFGVNKRIVALGEQVKFSFYPDCNSAETTYDEPSTGTFSGEVGVALYDENFNFITKLQSKNVSGLKNGIGESFRENVIIDPVLFKEGCLYRIAPYAKSVSSEMPTRIRTKRGEQDYYQVTVEDGVAKLRMMGIEFNDALTGRYKAMATNIKGETEEWYVRLRQSSSDYGDTRYELIDIDPAVSKELTTTYNWNYGYGDVNVDGTLLSLTVRNMGNDIRLNNFSGGKTIDVRMDSKNGKMFIDDTWGCTKTVGSGSSASSTEISRYSNTVFTYIEPVEIENPTVAVDKNNMMTLFTSTGDATIFYTIDGSIPNPKSSQQYTAPVELMHNCVIRAIAAKQDNESERTDFVVDWFMVERPEITIDEKAKIVTMTTLTDGATIYYTTDESTPTTESMKYEGAINFEHTAIFKAIAIKDDYNDSPINTMLVSLGEDNRCKVVTDNVAGELSARIHEQGKYELLSLTVTGQINGTDIKCIRDLSQNGNLYLLNIENASVVEGGEKYDGIYSTANDVIGNNMFSDSKKMETLRLPLDTKEICSFAFKGCDNLHTLEIPAKVKSIDGYAFANNNAIEHINVVPHNEWLKSEDGVVYSKDGAVLILCPTEKQISSYTIPEGVTEIATRAFAESPIAEIELPSTLRKIGRYAFNNCVNIKELIIPNSVISVESGAFEGCKGLVSVVVSSNVKEIESFTFSCCVNLQRFFVGEKVEIISPYAFNSCSSLLEFTVEENNDAFCSQDGAIYSKDMTSLVLFPRGRYVESLNIPESVVRIENSAFSDCHNVSEFLLPQSLRYIGEYAFHNCNMRSISMPEGVAEIDQYAFNGCDQLESFVFPSSVKNISDCVLMSCRNLSYLFIPSTVQNVGQSAFLYSTNLKVINSRIKDIAGTEFKPSWGGQIQAFDKIPADCTWRVPAGGAKGTPEYEKYANLYKAQPWWVPTWNIIIDDATTDIDAAIAYDHGMSWNSGKLFITPNSNDTINIYSVSGSLIKSFIGKSGKQYQIELPRGMYIINNKKVMLK